MNLPEMPKPTEFSDGVLSHNIEMFQKALEAWERICRELIKNLPCDRDCCS